MNIVEEAIREIETYGYSTDEVLWVGSEAGLYSISWEQFSELGQNVDDNKCHTIDLVIVAKDWWLSREYSTYRTRLCWRLQQIPLKDGDAREFGLRALGYMLGMDEDNE